MRSISVMAGGGRYNDHSAPQHVAAELALPLLVEAAELVPVDRERGVVIADYGSSQGRNSMGPMCAVIDKLRRRLSPEVPISVVHTDLPGNDFAALFKTLENDPSSYLRDAHGVFAYAAGRSFYDQIFPASHVSLGWTSIAVHWLSRVPLPGRGHIFSTLAEPAVREAFARQSEHDWREFLRHRARELVSGGRLVVMGSGADEEGRSGAEGLMELANSVLLEMVSGGTLRREEYDEMVVPTYYRTVSEFTAELLDGALSEALELVACSQIVLPDPLWAGFQKTGDLARYAAVSAEFLRAFTEPSLFGPLGAGRSPRECVELADEFYRRVRQAIQADPEATECAWQLVLLAIVKR